MALHNLVFVIDLDQENDASDDRLDVKNHFVKRGLLYILLHFGYKYGFDKVRWGYKFFQSKLGRNASFITRASDFKELRHKTFEDFEQEFEARFDGKDTYYPRQKRQSNKSVSVQNALKETLLDFQWDRPDITSPTKLSLRPRKSSRVGEPSVSHGSETSSSGKNVVFIVSQCPHSRTQLLDYLSLQDDDLLTDVAEFILSKSLNNMLVQRQVVLHWIDNSSHVQVMNCKDYLGCEKLSEVLTQVGGRLIPVVALMNLCCNHQADSGFMREAFAFKPSIGYLLSSERLYRLSFPAVAGVLLWDQGNVTHSCGVMVEPVSRRQRLLQDSVQVCLKGVLQSWDSSSLIQISTETWVLQGSSDNEQGAAALQHLLEELFGLSLHMLAEVNDNGLLYSAVFSPLSPSTALLTVLHPTITQHDQLQRMKMIVPATAETSPDLPDVVTSVLGVIYDDMNKDSDGISDDLKDHSVPEWALQEFSHSPQTLNMLETWFPQSDQSGVSTHLMESMKLLHAVPDEAADEEFPALHQELISGLSELYQGTQDSSNKRGKKRGAHRTPVKQKMKTMSRSLQMLNVARLNVKAQKTQAEAEQVVTEGRGADRQGKRRLSDRSKSGGASTISFTCEEELLTHLKASYDKTVAERDSSLLTSVQQLLTAVKTFHMAESDWEMKALVLIQQHLLKTSKSIRQLYGVASDPDGKVRECQLQAVLRLELCRLFSSAQSDSLDADLMAEEVAEMLRIISLTKDPVYLTRFLQDEVLPGFLIAVPRVLAEIYHSLGTQLPDALAAALPADFFSDESVAKHSSSPFASSPPVSTRSQDSSSKDGLQDLRNRSASKRRSGMLTRHRSMTESAQTLRQIELPKNTRASKTKGCVAMEKPVRGLHSQKQETQEVTKVRRNLFNQEIISPSKKAKLPRSQSVSAVEGLKHKHTQDSAEQHKLLTKKVSETPLHKQGSSRFLHRQKMGRRSDCTEECIVEESPVKPAEDLRRSPRIKKLARRRSSTFYSSSQPRSRNLEKALSASQLTLSDSKICGLNVKTVQSPLRLLFGAADSPIHVPDRSDETRTTRSRPSTDSSVFESPNKTPTESFVNHRRCFTGTLSPRTPSRHQTPGTPKTPTSSKMGVSSVAQSPVAGSSGVLMSPIRSSGREPLVAETPTKQNPVTSPLKGILKTPVKTQHSYFSGSHLLSSPVSKTPKKSVTWSPSPQKYKVVEDSVTFKVPKSPNTPSVSSERVFKTPNKLKSDVQGTNAKRDIFKTPDKICQVNLVRLSEQDFLTPEKNPRSSEECNSKTPEKGGAGNLLETPPLLFTPTSEQQISPQPCTRTQEKSPTHQMVTRSGWTPRKSTKTSSPCDPAFTPLEVCTLSEELDTSVKSPAKALTRMRLGQGGRRTRNGSKSSESFAPELNSASAENLVEQTVRSFTQKENAEGSQTSESGSSLQTESEELDSSQGTSATTREDSLDIVDAAVVKTEFNKGLKMNIRFSRKRSTSDEGCLSNTVSPTQCSPSQSARGRNYGFRQTPDRQQREAAARLGYENDFPRFSTPRGPARSKRQKNAPSPLTYQVELEGETSGLPKLKLKRTNSLNPDDAGQSPSRAAKPFVESPVALTSKLRDPGCSSPAVCPHVTPAKNTPGKGGGVQTYICQAYTPTRHPTATLSPVTAEIIPLTPSPQSVGKVTPENLNSWHRRKRAHIGVFGFKDPGFKGEPQLEELLEEAELGVSRLQDFEDSDEPSSHKAEGNTLTSKRSPSAAAGVCPLSPQEDLFWMEKLAEQNSCADPLRDEVVIWSAENQDLKSKGTPPSIKKRKPVSASGILALTQSPLLFKGKTDSAQKRPLNSRNEATTGRTDRDEVELSPVKEPIRRSNTGKTYSRKRLLH